MERMTNKRNGGEKKVVGAGTRPREIVGTKDSHFTIVPITNATGELVMVVIIFASKNLNSTWCTGEDVYLPLTMTPTILIITTDLDNGFPGSNFSMKMVMMY